MIDTKKTLLISNPAAGKMKSKTALFEIISKFCAHEYIVTVQITQYRSHASEIAEKGAGEYDLIVCCGGDGTLNEVVSGILKSGKRAVLGYIPAGSTNDFASTLGLKKNVAEAAEAIISGNIVDIDAGILNDRYFCYIASFGAFSAASYNTSQASKNVMGHFAYLLSGVTDLSSLKKYHVSYEIDSGTYEGDYIFGSVSNSTSVAGIVKIDPNTVDLSDGLFEVNLVKYPKNLIELSKIISGITSSDFSGEMFSVFKTANIKFSMSSDIPWTLDGEYYQGSSSIEIKNLSHAISLIK